MLAVSSIYGIDNLEDNIAACHCETFDYLKKTYPNRTVAQDRFLQTRTFYGKEKKSRASIIGIINTFLSNTDNPASACHVTN